MTLYAFLITALVGFVLAVPKPDGVTDKLLPAGSAPASCVGSYNGPFEVTINLLKKRDVVEAQAIQKRDACGGNSILVVTLADGVLKDEQGRTGYVASNFQFQFDGPPQAGSLVTAGFSVCGNGSLALGSSTVFYQCLSGTFYNLYDRHWAEQCQPIHIDVLACGGASNPVGQIADGQIIGTTMVATTLVTVLPDGQPQAVPTQVPIPMCQIADGQVQAHTTPCASVTVPVVTPRPVSQIPDGQIQVPPPTPSAAVPAPPAPAASTPAAPIPAGPATTPVVVPATTAKPSAPPASSSPAPSAPVSQAGAGRVATASLLAVGFGILGAVWCL